GLPRVAALVQTEAGYQRAVADRQPPQLAGHLQSAPADQEPVEDELRVRGAADGRVAGQREQRAPLIVGAQLHVLAGGEEGIGERYRIVARDLDDAVVAAERGERAGDRRRATGSWHRDELGVRGDDRVERRLPAVLAAADRGAEGVVVADPDIIRGGGVGRE